MAKTFEIHPSIGIARVGTSDEFFLGPEPGGAPPSKFRDSAGKLKRQAARFRVFECERDDQEKLQSARELTPNEAQIKWTVHLVNRKGAAPKFANPSGGNRNNATGNDATDSHLIIDPGERSVTGPNQGPARFDTGKFMNVGVPLGDIRTDADGRLLVLGGFGTSDSVPPQPDPSRPIQGFADSNNWYDDISDGPVKATITLTGTNQTIDAKTAWVIVAPPDYAPEIYNLVTLYDVAYQVAVDRGWLSVPATSSFTRHIQPILSRAVGYQWVNKFNRQGHSGTRPGNFAKNWAALADPAHPPAEANVILARLRDASVSPASAPSEPDPRRWMPRLHDETNSKQVLPLTRAQYTALRHWAAGNFVNDLGGPPAEELLPDALDRAAMEACSGGAFFPGIEAGRIMKQPEVYVAPLRLDADALKPGQITQGNAVPWQADFWACSWESQSFIGWWPAQRPDQVLPEAAPTIPQEWDRGISGDLGERGLVKSWHRLGVVVRRTGPGGEIFVETERDPEHALG
jgi:hypothetical protein